MYAAADLKHTGLHKTVFVLLCSGGDFNTEEPYRHINRLQNAA